MMDTCTQLDLNGIRKAKNAARLFIISACVCSVYLATLPSQIKPLTVTALPTIELSFVQFEEPPLPTEAAPVESVERLLAEESEIKVETPPEPKEPAVVPAEPPVAEPTVIPPPAIPIKNIKKKIVQEKPRKKEVNPVPKPLPIKNSKPETKPSSNESIKPASLAGSASDLQANNKLASLLIALIEKKKKYPKAAIRSGTEGTCHAKFRFDKEGRIIAASLSVPSGKGVLDRASNQLAQQLIGTNFNIPNSGIGIEIQVPIKFELVNR